MTDRVIPFSSAAQAYGQARPLTVRPVAQVAQTPRAAAHDTLDLSAAARARTAPTHPLAAARVDAPISFDGVAPARAQGALPIYTHPADRNTAATSINAGRLVDLEG